MRSGNDARSLLGLLALRNGWVVKGHPLMVAEGDCRNDWTLNIFKCNSQGLAIVEVLQSLPIKVN